MAYKLVLAGVELWSNIPCIRFVLEFNFTSRITENNQKCGSLKDRSFLHLRSIHCSHPWLSYIHLFTCLHFYGHAKASVSSISRINLWLIISYQLSSKMWGMGSYIFSLCWIFQIQGISDPSHFHK